ncbi:MAG TPA: NAD(P)H-dependent oxidoreductase subunit E, partial [Deinococcales bacterium]|nr:NAD(P)H-dependent oxidoreductase subunit E [Deinococcales bacterium]
MTHQDLGHNQDHQHPHQFRVCCAASCQSLHSEEVAKALQDEAARQGRDDCTVKQVGCLGLCSNGPLIAQDDGKIMYQRVTPEDAPRLIASIEKEPVQDLLCPTDQPFFQRQLKVVLENAGTIDPNHIGDYVAHGGYEALKRALTMTPDAVIEEVFKSGLRGRGGAGYPTGLKWQTVRRATGEQKYVVCNGDEGDPGAYMDRSVLESDPHRILEGMAIAAYAVGADRAYAYVRAEYPLAVKRLKSAIRQAERAGMLGQGILGTNFNLDVEIRLGAGAFVCGEETALLASIEGKRGTPRARPPYPAESGLWG